MSRFHFGKDFRFYFALLSETESLNPFSRPTKKSKCVWEEIASKLKSSDLKLDVNYRQCRDRVILLLGQFRGQEALSIKSSGIEEAEMDKVKYLLTSVSSLQETGPVMSNKIVQNKRKRNEAELTRNDAVLMTELLDDEGPDLTSFDDDVTKDGSEVIIVGKGEGQQATTQSHIDDEKPIKRGKRGRETASLIEYLKNKSKDEIGVKTEELKVRAAEAENKKLELQLLKDRQDAELKDKQKFTDMILDLVKQIPKK